MEYRVFGKTIVARIDRGEEILSSLQAVCEKEGVKLAEVSALGAVESFTVALYDVPAREYHEHTYTFPAEITSLWGTVTTRDGAFYAHVHMSAADACSREYGGHLKEAKVSATAEMVIHVLDGQVEREYNEEVGLNLMKFL